MALLAKLRGRSQAIDAIRVEIERLCDHGRQIELHELELLHELPEVYQVHALEPLLHKKIQEATQELVEGSQRVRYVFDQHFPPKEGAQLYEFHSNRKDTK